MSKVIIVEGIISSGKTTLVKELAPLLGASTLTLLEPDEKGGQNPYLARYYADPARWALTMQVHLLQRRYRMHLHAQWHALEDHGHALLDRSYFGDTAFARLQLAHGLMGADEYSTYQSIYQSMTASVLFPSVCIRLRVDPEVARQRIASRMTSETGRQCEAGVSLAYLSDLDAEIDRVTAILGKQGVRILEIPWGEDRPDPERRAKMIQSIAAAIHAIPDRVEMLDLHPRVL